MLNIPVLSAPTGRSVDSLRLIGIKHCVGLIDIFALISSSVLSSIYSHLQLHRFS